MVTNAIASQPFPYLRLRRLPRHRPTTILLLLLLLASCPYAQAAWGADVNVANKCSENIKISLNNSTYVTLDYGESYTWTLCESWCTGFFGASKPYSLQYKAYADDCPDDLSWSGSGSVSVNAFKFENAEDVVFTCSSGCPYKKPEYNDVFLGSSDITRDNNSTTCCNDNSNSDYDNDASGYSAGVSYDYECVSFCPTEPRCDSTCCNDNSNSDYDNDYSGYYSVQSSGCCYHCPTDKITSQSPVAAPIPSPAEFDISHSTTESSSSNNTALILGLSIGLGGAFLLSVAAGFIAWHRRRNKRKNSKPPTIKQRSKDILPLPFIDSHQLSTSTPSISDDAFLTSLASTIPANRSTSLATMRRSSSGPYRIINFEDIEVISKLSEGSFGKVYKAKWGQTIVALKILTDRTFGDYYSSLTAETGSAEAENVLIDAMFQEAELMAALRHPNIVQFLAVCLVPPVIVTEWCVRGSLYDVLRLASGEVATVTSQLTWLRRLNMAYDTAKGMLYLHSNSPSAVIHRDLKSPNLLVTADWTVKVADFNLSRLAEEYNNNNNGEQEQPDGPTQPRWLAPEVMRGKPFTEASDVFSFAVVLWELLTWKLPWSRGIASHGGVMNAVLRGDRLRIPEAGELPGDSDKFPGLDEYVELMKECWVDDPAERPGFESIAIRLGEMVASQLSYVRTSPNEKVPPRVYIEIQGLFNRIVDSSGPLNITDAFQYHQDIRMLRKSLSLLPDVFSKEPAIQVNTQKWVRMLAAQKASYQLNVEELGEMNRDFADALSDYNSYLQAQS